MSIEVANTFYKINNYKLGDCPTLENKLRVWDKVIFNYTWVNYIYDPEEKTLLVPGGLRLSYLQKLFPNKVTMYDTIKETPYRHATYKCVVDPRDEEQEEAIEFLLQDEKQLMLCMNTGGGKTYCTINALAQMKKRAVIIVDKDKIMQQWKSEILKFTNLTEDDIYLISGRDSITKLINNKKDPGYKIFIASHRTLDSFAGDEWNDITTFFNKMKIGVKVFDEAHVEVKNICMIDYHTNVSKTIYLTATPSRSNPLEDAVYQSTFYDVPRHGLEKKFEDPHNIIYYVSYNSKPGDFYISKCTTKRGFDTNLFSDYTFELRYDLFVETIQKFLDITLKQPGKTCIIVHKNDHIVKLKETLMELYPDEEIGTFCGLINNKSERDKELEKRIILSTDKSMGKGVDVQDLQFVIMTCPTSSRIVAEQTIGRLRKLKDGRQTIYFDITDIGFSACRSQLKKRREILDMKAKKIKILKL